jgi:hypothetical protein
VDAAEGRPIRGVRIQVPSHSIPDVFTDENGRFTLSALPVGRYWVTAGKAGYVTAWRRDGSPSGDFQIVGPPVDLSAGEVKEQTDFALTKGGVITGRVVDDRGREVLGARVYVYRSRWQEGRQVVVPTGGAADQTNDLGEFRLFGMSSGTYLLGVDVARPGGGGREIVYYPGSYSPGEAQPVTVRSGEELSASITLPPVSSGSIAGIVNQEGGPIPPQTSVVARRVSQVESTSITASIRADGSYRLVALVPGEYEVTAYTIGTTPRRFATSRVIVDGQDVFVPLTLSGGGTIRGRYRFDTGSPPAGISLPRSGGVMPVVLPHEDARSMSVASDWSFSITGLVGAYRLTPPLPAGWHVKQITRNGTDITWQQIEVEGETIDSVEILLTQKVTHLAVSLNGTDTELEDTTVLIFPEAESRIWYSSPFQRVIRVGRGRLSSETSSSTDRRSLMVSALPAARYYAVAVAGLDDGQETNPAFLRRLTAIASKVELVENETRQVPLKINQLP